MIEIMNNAKIYYTPYVWKPEKFEIPESSFLDPIQLSQEIAQEVMTEKEPVTQIPLEVPRDQQTNAFSNLTWARRQKSKSSTDTIDLNRVKDRQRFRESANNPKAVSKAGAKGLYQIIDGTHNDYIKATGEQGDIFDPIYNEKVRDWYMDRLADREMIKEGNASDKVKLAKQLAAYNWGIENLTNYLKQKKNAGEDIYQSMDWINELPKETKNYINYILA